MRTTANGGPKGYRQITETNSSIGAGQQVRLIHCQDPGDKKCPDLPEGVVLDIWTTGVLNQVLEATYISISHGNLEGVSQTVFVDPVSGTRFLFTVVWDFRNENSSAISVDKSPIVE
jgi:hypothetical protein